MSEHSYLRKAYHEAGLRRKSRLILQQAANEALRLGDRNVSGDDPAAVSIDVLMGTKTHPEGFTETEWVRSASGLSWVTKHPGWVVRHLMLGSDKEGRYISLASQPIEVPKGVATPEAYDELLAEMQGSEILLQAGPRTGRHLPAPLLNRVPVEQALGRSELEHESGLQVVSTEVSPLDLLASTVRQMSLVTKLD